MSEEVVSDSKALVSIVAFSGSGHTRQMSDAVAAGVKRSGAADLFEHHISDDDFTGGRWLNEDVLARLDTSDAIIFGAPTYMGGIPAQLKAFMDATSPRYMERRWIGKVGAAFTVSGAPSGDKLAMLTGCVTFAMQHGMIWVGVAESPVTGEGYNPLGFYLGAAGEALFEPPQEKPSAEDKRTGEMLGRRVALTTQRLHGHPAA
tara:strand:+ start:252443 stop:253054 length:612 start_codon:yes stop_codon:yes gene_type:complete